MSEARPGARGVRGALIVVALCAVSAGLGFGAYHLWQPRAPEASSSDLRPDLEFHSLMGTTHKLSEWNGKLLLLNFWATWCAPCLKEIPLLVEAQASYGARGFQIVGIAMDDTDAVREFAKRLHMNYPVMAGGPEIMQAMDQLGDTLGALPFSVLISPDGRILARTSGALERDEIEKWAKEHLPG